MLSPFDIKENKDLNSLCDFPQDTQIINSKPEIQTWLKFIPGTNTSNDVQFKMSMIGPGGGWKVPALRDLSFLMVPDEHDLMFW